MHLLRALSGEYFLLSSDPRANYEVFLRSPSESRAARTFPIPPRTALPAHAAPAPLIPPPSQVSLSRPLAFLNAWPLKCIGQGHRTAECRRGRKQDKKGDALNVPQIRNFTEKYNSSSFTLDAQLIRPLPVFPQRRFSARNHATLQPFRNTVSF